MARQSTRALIRSKDLKSRRGTALELPALLEDPVRRDRWQRDLHDPESIVVLDLFCGAGGLSHGFLQANVKDQPGFVIGAGIDNNPWACKTHAANIPSGTRCLDITQVSDPRALIDELGIPRVDVIIGGPPCQGFSQAGRAVFRRLTPEQRQRVEDRNRLYFEFVRFVRALSPQFFVMENVPTIGTHSDEINARVIADHFAPEYGVQPYLLEASRFGVPQMRRRLFFVGSRSGWVPPWVEPRPTHGDDLDDPVRTLADAIADLPAVQAPFLEDVMRYVPRHREDLRGPDGHSVSIDSTYLLEMRMHMPPGQRDLLFDHIVRPVRDDDREVFIAMKQGDGYLDVKEEYRRYAVKHSGDGDYHFSDRYSKLRWDRPCSTIVAHMAKDGYKYIYPDPDQPRTLSLREAARIQSFPDHFRFTGFRTNRLIQIGNAVPPLLARAIAERVADAIRYFREGVSSPEWKPAFGEMPGWQPPLPGLIDSWQPPLDAVGSRPAPLDAAGLL